jgi:hypothetical protein
LGPSCGAGPGRRYYGSAREPGSWGLGLGLGPRFGGRGEPEPEGLWARIAGSEVEFGGAPAGWAHRLRPGPGPKSLHR